MEIERWFQAEIVDLDDPRRMGRVKVRELVGQDKEEVDNLFWCHVIMPPTGANARGVGVAAVWGVALADWTLIIACLVGLAQLIHSLYSTYLKWKHRNQRWDDPK